MSQPKEICLEELDRGSGDQDDECFVRCVALPGAQPGLALDREGSVQWMPEGPSAYALCVSADDRLVLVRAEGAGPLSVERGNRSLVAPAGQPVVLLDQDLIRLDGRRLRLHVHGEAQAVHAPERLSATALGRLARAAAMAAGLALGGATGMAAAAAGAGQGAQGPGGAVATEAPTIEVRTRPPVVARPSRQVECSIDRQKASAKGPLVINATCKDPKGLAVGQHGVLIDVKTNANVKDGMVKITTMSGMKIVVEAVRLRKAVPNARIRFYVYD